jgi:flagellar hook assembly protein FlgD
VPARFIISNAFPNPFNPSTSISVDLNTDSDVSVKVFNVMGQIVHVLSEGQMAAGTHSFTWDASDYPSGIYIISSLIDNNAEVQKIMLLK